MYTNDIPAAGAAFDLTRITGSSPSIRAEITNRFSSKPWDLDKVERGGAVTMAAIELVVTAVENVPASRVRTRAINMIEEARMLLNLAITHEGRY